MWFQRFEVWPFPQTPRMVEVFRRSSPRETRCSLKRGFRQVQFDRGYGATATGPAYFSQHLRLAQRTCLWNDGLPAVLPHRMESVALGV